MKRFFVTFNYINAVLFMLLFLIGDLSAQELKLNINEKPENVTIFIYHKFGEDKYPTTNVAVDRFEEQMQYLADNGYSVLSLSDVVDRIKNWNRLPEKAAVITIDDGYTSTYNSAWPVLKKFGYPFTVFLYVKAVEKKYRNFLTWEQIKEMQNAGVDFQDHGYSHHRFGNRPEGDLKEYREWIKNDLQKGNNILSEHLGYKPTCLALPYGEYNTIVQEVAKEIGYSAVFSQDPGSLSSSIDLFAIPREPILGNDWATMSHFEMVLERRDLPFNNMIPPVEPLTNLAPEKFCVNLLTPDAYKESSLGVYVSELGWQKGILQDDQLCIKNNATLERRSNRVAVSGIEKATGNTAIRYWLLMK